MSWDRSDLASVVSVLESGSRPKGGASTESGEIPSLGGENILKSGGVTLDRVKRVPRRFYERMTKGHLLDADVLINKDGAQTGKVGLYGQQNGTTSCINEHLFLIRGNAKKITQEYLYYTLLSQPSQNQIDAQISGSAQPGLKSDFLRGVFAEIPGELSEQTKIAEVLSTVDQAIDRTEALIAKQQRIKTGLMQDLLTRGIDKDGNLRSEDTHEFKNSPLGRIPVEWETKNLEDLTIRIGDGIHSTPNYSEHTDYFFINGNNLGEGSIRVTSNTLCVDEKEYRKYFIGLDERTILYSINGTIGNIAFYKGEKVILGKSAAYIRCKPSVNEKLIYYILQSQPVKKIYEYEMTGSTIRNLSLSAIRNTPIKMPSDGDEQELITKKIESLSKAVNDQKLSLTKLSSLKTALMQDLLTGKVSVTPLLTEGEVGA